MTKKRYVTPDTEIIPLTACPCVLTTSGGNNTQIFELIEDNGVGLSE